MHWSKRFLLQVNLLTLLVHASGRLKQALHLQDQQLLVDNEITPLVLPFEQFWLASVQLEILHIIIVIVVFAFSFQDLDRVFKVLGGFTHPFLFLKLYEWPFAFTHLLHEVVVHDGAHRVITTSQDVRILHLLV